jgi:FkbH-like protein
VNKRTLSCALLSSFTLDQVANLATSRLETIGVSCRWFVAPFNQYAQTILADDSELVAASPQAVFLAVAIEDLLENLPSPWTKATERRAEAEKRIADFLCLIGKLSSRLPSATIFVHDFLPLAPEANLILADHSGVSMRQLALQANCSLEKLVAGSRNLHIVSLNYAFRTLPHTALYDARFFYIGKMRLGRDAVNALAEHYSRLLSAFAGFRKKCIVLDLDNTLWGGVLGEDGLEHLQLSDDGPGKAFQDMQRILLDYHETGTLLAICSKNDESLAVTAIREHPAMLLRPNHFAAMRINWQSKAVNLREIAAELNLDLNSFVFLDDLELERAEIRHLTSAVTTPDLPKDPSDYPAFLAQLSHFDALGTTEDDRRRGQMYSEDRERRAQAQTAGSLEDFLKGLQLQVVVRRADRQSVVRLAQLSQRTNQFNLTTRRYTQSDLLALLENQNWRLYELRVSDRIGDSGVSGAAFVQVDLATESARLDTFLVSCRVLGRGIESAFLAGVCSDLYSAGIATLAADYIPSQKNGVAQNFLPKHCFQSANGSWRLASDKGQGVCPDWIRLILD